MEARSVVRKDFRANAELLSHKVAQLLSTSVIVLDDQENVIAMSLPEGSNRGGDSVLVRAENSLTVPVQLEDSTVQVVVAPPTTGEVVSLRLVQAAVDLVAEETSAVEQLQRYAEVKDKFIFDLLQGNLKNDDQILRSAKFLGLDLRPPRAVILIDASAFVLSQDGIPPDRLDSKRRAQRVINSVVTFFHLPNDAICAHIGAGEVIVLKASDTRNLLSWVDRTDATGEAACTWANLTALKRAAKALLARLQQDTQAAINVGIGRYYPGLNGLSKSYNEAKAALTLGTRLGALNCVHSLDELGVAAFIGVSDEQTKIELASHLLGPLENEPDILHTLNVFFAQNCSPSAAAKQLNVHRNSLRGRLDRVDLLTGLDPRAFDDAVLIRLALLLRDLR